LATGASCGLGCYITGVVLESGNSVIVTARDMLVLTDLSSKYSDTQFLSLKFNVTNESNISPTFATTLKAF
ncbi:hypothetical protein C8J56DRAFT_710865, partial [Mycena floridula]